VWVSNTASNTVTRIDTARRRATNTIKVCASPVNLEVVGRDVWVPCDRGDALARISVKTRKRVETVPMAGGPAVVAGGAGDVWASAFEAGQVWRLRPG
jgi:YVTN family beta-propeller protein